MSERVTSFVQIDDDTWVNANYVEAVWRGDWPNDVVVTGASGVVYRADWYSGTVGVDKLARLLARRAERR